MSYEQMSPKCCLALMLSKLGENQGKPSWFKLLFQIQGLGTLQSPNHPWTLYQDTINSMSPSVWQLKQDPNWVMKQDNVMKHPPKHPPLESALIYWTCRRRIETEVLLTYEYTLLPQPGQTLTHDCTEAMPEDIKPSKAFRSRKPGWNMQ